MTNLYSTAIVNLTKVKELRAFLVSCGNPGRPYNGYATGSRYTEGSTVYFHCSRYNYRLYGASSTRCQSNGAWSNPTPSCKYTKIKYFIV